MTGYVMAPTPPQIAEHIEKWDALRLVGVEGLPADSMELMQLANGRWVGADGEAAYWRSVPNQHLPRHGYRLPPLPSLPPSPETVVVVDANTAHGLIGRSIGGEEIGFLSVGRTGVDFMGAGQGYIADRTWGSSVTLDPLPAPPPEPEPTPFVAADGEVICLANKIPLAVRDQWEAHDGDGRWCPMGTWGFHPRLIVARRAALAAEGGE